jgi:hypothetical protein
MLNQFIAGSISKNIAFQTEDTAFFLNEDQTGLIHHLNQSLTISWACNTTHLDMYLEGNHLHRWRYVEKSSNSVTLVDEKNSTCSTIFTMRDMTTFQMSAAAKLNALHQKRINNMKTRYTYLGIIGLVLVSFILLLDRLLPFSNEMPLFMNSITGVILTYGFHERAKYRLVAFMDDKLSTKSE